jgi:hypothetical protein
MPKLTADDARNLMDQSYSNLPLETIYERIKNEARQGYPFCNIYSRSLGIFLKNSLSSMNDLKKNGFHVEVSDFAEGNYEIHVSWK